LGAHRVSPLEISALTSADHIGPQAAASLKWLRSSRAIMPPLGSDVMDTHGSTRETPMKLARISAMTASALTALIATAPIADAQGISVHQATLMEKDAKTTEVSTEQLRKVLMDGSAILIDTRSRAEFDAGHIPGARTLDAAPDQQIAAVERLAGGNKAAALVLYCNGPYCQASRRLGENLAAAGFTNVRRYQLGIPIWRALGGPTAIELGGIKRIFGIDGTAVYIDVRPASDFAKGSVAGALSGPADEVVSGKFKLRLPEDDFNRRIVLFGEDGAQARRLADFMSKRPWHNVTYFPGTFSTLADAVRTK
jgi:rhodanese-related sulfurtransferase